MHSLARLNKKHNFRCTSSHCHALLSKFRTKSSTKCVFLFRPRRMLRFYVFSSALWRLPAACVGALAPPPCREWSVLQYVRVSVCVCVCTEGWSLRPLATRTTAHFLSSKTLNESSRKSFARSSELFAVSDVTPFLRLCGSRIAVPRAFIYLYIYIFYCCAGLPSAAFEFMCMR